MVLSSISAEQIGEAFAVIGALLLIFSIVVPPEFKGDMRIAGWILAVLGVIVILVLAIFG